MARKKIVAGNWKMNKNLFDGKTLVDNILQGDFSLSTNQQVIIAPPYIQLPITASQLKDAQQIYLSAQNAHQQQSGAYTGEISPEMLKSIGVDYVILGHSERRQYFNEDNALLKEKVDAALDLELKVIFCVGEPLEVREANQQNDYVANQIKDSLFHLPKAKFFNLTIAYEPIWAIGTGKTATSEQAQEMHAHIRSVLSENFGNAIAEETSILYGGSCKPHNAKELFDRPDVDGGLIGGASLNADDFVAIINAL